MWEIKGADSRQSEDISKILEEGYEPFAVSTSAYGEATIWFKRVTNEVLSKPDSDEGTSGRTTAKTKK